MSSKYPPGFYDQETVAALAQAFKEVWTTVMTNDPFREFGKDEKLRQIIVDTMLKLADEGVCNVDELRTRTLAKVTIPQEFLRPSTHPSRRRSPKAA